MKIGVVGVTGMLGHHTARAGIERGHEIVALQRPSSDLSKIADLGLSDVRTSKLTSAPDFQQVIEGLDAVIHCAAYYPTVPRRWTDDVERGLQQMNAFYDACESVTLNKIVYLGGSIALQRAVGRPGRESDSYPGQPADKNPYVQVKWALDKLALDRASDTLPIVVGIPSMTFGEYDFGPTTGAFVTEIANETVTNYVGGNRNVVYAGDAGLGLVLCAESGRIGERYLITGENLAMRELTTMIAEIANVPAPKAVPLGLAKVLSRIQRLRHRFGGPLPKLSDSAIAVMAAGQFLDGEKAKVELGYESTVAPEDAIKRAYAWFVRNEMVRK